MGKNKKKQPKAKRENRQHHPQSQVPSLSTSSKSQQSEQLPLAFPHGPDTRLPTKGFLRDEGVFRQTYKLALDTSYEGFAVDTCPDEDNAGSTIRQEQGEMFQHAKIRNALCTMQDAGFFRTDVTQPFGLGTKCAKTYVTRCLLGEAGTTYKYLGLRMFAHPWDGSAEKEGVVEAVKAVSDLNETLTHRTLHHLSELNKKRRSRGAEPTKGRAGFDVTLINRMENTSDLKSEVTTGEGRCSVSWHADSSLENHSTIGVYHTIFSDSTKLNELSRTNNIKPAKRGGARWSVALRVAHNSEGPNASRRVVAIESSVVKETPAIAASLPSGSCYYLLDDFNHHHQHTVLASGDDGNEKDAGVRFSSTHRLLREGHNINFVIERCRTVCSNFHKKGPKIWRSEQLLLTEIESEWLRQFYIQGEGHKRLLWKAWQEPIETLSKYWQRLEDRTKQVMDLLRGGAEASCGLASGNDGALKQERKRREKRKKALSSLQDIIQRSNEVDQAQTKSRGATIKAADIVYEPFAALLGERSTMRALWMKREKDQVFRRMDSDYWPIPFPLSFDKPDQLQQKMDNLKCWGKAFDLSDPSLLPSSKDDEEMVTQSLKESYQERDLAVDVMYSKPLTWEGWSQHKFGLEMQKPWASLLISGGKTIETRAYSLPHALLGKRIEILETKAGKPGVSSMGNSILGGENIGQAINQIGWCTFESVITYTDKRSFEEDATKHKVSSSSGYSWKDGETKVIYGWVVGKNMSYSQRTDKPDAQKLSSIARRMRSLYELTLDDDENKVIKPTDDRMVGSSSQGRNRGKRKGRDRKGSQINGQKKKRF